MRAPPKPTTRSRTLMATPLAAAGILLFPDRGEEHREQAVEHDDEKDRLDHRGGGVQAERFRAALDLEALDAGHDPDHQRHERRLDHADLEGVERDRLLEAREKHVRIDAAVAPGDQRAAVDRSEERRVGKECRARWWPYHSKKKEKSETGDAY